MNKKLLKVVFLSTSIVLGGVAITYNLEGLDKIEAATTVKINKTSYQTTANIYLRSNASMDSNKIVLVPKGKTVIASEKRGSWYKVSYSYKSGDKEMNKTGWVVEKYIKEKLKETLLSGKTFYVTSNLNLRKTAESKSTVLKVIPKGKIVVPSHKVSNGWYKLTYSGKTGYVSGSYIKEVKTGDPLKNRDSYQFIDLRMKSPVKAEQINQYIANYVKLTGKKSVLTGKGQAFIDAGNKYGVNALYLAAHAIHESAYGTSNISLGKNNLFGFGAFDAAPYVAAYRFQSVNKNIEYIAQEMKATYLNPNSWKYNGPHLGFTTKTLKNARVDDHSEGMNFYYASDPLWGKGIAAHMQKILPYDKRYYSAAKPNTKVFPAPPKPTGSDKFPSGIIAVSKKDLGLSNKKGSTSIVKKLSKGKKFIILEKSNDFWVRVKYAGKEYWTSSIKFDQYNSYLSVKNLGRVTTPVLNVRPTASTSKKPIGSLKLNQYVQLVLNKDGKLTMNSSKTWYKIKLSNGKTGWVSKSYLAQELK
ncbi:SH3 domain-containing protein [Bacillus massilinigeriensis]|uniref:SH3 domain-containing protein n=1 Tax=Bacillus massilionigeriensis TaxID=1805475 RepID=UPI00096ADE12|nr:SH3 domain-containing protein [Bacillus massilionigeriensis]